MADRADDVEKNVRRALRRRKIEPMVAKRRTEHGRGLGKFGDEVEACFNGLFHWRRLRLRHKKRDDIDDALLNTWLLHDLVETNAGVLFERVNVSERCDQDVLRALGAIQVHVRDAAYAARKRTQTFHWLRVMRFLDRDGRPSTAVGIRGRSAGVSRRGNAHQSGTRHACTASLNLVAAPER